MGGLGGGGGGGVVQLHTHTFLKIERRPHLSQPAARLPLKSPGALFVCVCVWVCVL